jgi:hypothetical protein
MHSFDYMGSLPNQNLASYGWGTNLIKLSPESAYANRAYLMKAIAGLAEGMGIWTTESEFLAFVSLAHETAHYQQDLTTGVGHWDYLERKKFRNELLGAFRDYSWLKQESILEQAKQRIRDLAAASLFNAYNQRAARALADIKSAMEQFENYASGQEGWFTLPRVFELDAIVNVWRSVNALRLTEKGEAIRSRLEAAYNPFHMPSDYSETFTELLGAYLRVLGLTEASSREEVLRASDSFKLLIPMWIDISLAYPPPDYFATHPDSHIHFEPGTRLLRMFRHLQKLETMPSLASNVDQLVWVDELSRHTAEYDYPSLEDVYSQWIAYIERENQDDPILSWRKNLCRKRLDEPVAFSHRRIEDFIPHDLPLWVNSPGQEGDYLYTTQVLMGDEGADLFWSLVAVERDFSLIDLFLKMGGGVFRCPLASEGLCEAFEPHCRNIAAVDELPASDKCVIRSGLRKAGFKFQDSLPAV